VKKNLDSAIKQIEPGTHFHDMRSSGTSERGVVHSATWLPGSTEANSPVRKARVFQPAAAPTSKKRRHRGAILAGTAHRDLLNEDLQSAREVQERLLPQGLVQAAGLAYSGRCRPALFVGGDFYDFFAMSDGGIGFAVGDVSGKGVSAALLAASLQASLRSLASLSRRSLSTLTSDLNRLICANTPPNRYATLFLAAYKPQSRRLTYVICGHNPPMVFRHSEVFRLEEGGPPVGMFRSASYSQSSIRFQPDDCLVAFTDGIREAKNPTDEEFGDERLMEAVYSGRKLPVQSHVEHVFTACDRFAGTAPQNDDMTLFVLRSEGGQ
jgi:sigma-B regulation protein RsbU (phosphoserine phosphatase)